MFDEMTLYYTWEMVMLLGSTYLLCCYTLRMYNKSVQMSCLLLNLGQWLQKTKDIQ